MTMANTGTREFQGESTGQQGLPREDRGGGGSAREQIREVKNQVVDQAKSTFQQAKERAGSSLGESKGQFADQVGAVAEALRRTTEHLRSEDQTRIAGLTETLARQIDQVSNYLRNKDAAAMRQDLTNVARRQPAVAIGGALLLGLIGARFLKSSERRNQREWSGERGYGREGRYGREYGTGQSRLGESGSRGYSGYDEVGGGYAGA
jgi:hypothetical protein